MQLKTLQITQFLDPEHARLRAPLRLGERPLTARNLTLNPKDYSERSLCVLKCQREVFQSGFYKLPGLNLGRLFCV